jgi:hypothetical protein
MSFRVCGTTNFVHNLVTCKDQQSIRVEFNLQNFITHTTKKMENENRVPWRIFGIEIKLWEIGEHYIMRSFVT